ncbi:MAG: hypothetical protein FWF31_00660 [Desulfobulbus sp.]|nr:hypothetical protein [Desulfobulbus sp.]
MPGAYAHLTMASLLNSPNALTGLGELSKQELAPLLLHIDILLHLKEWNSEIS